MTSVLTSWNFAFTWSGNGFIRGIGVRALDDNFVCFGIGYRVFLKLIALKRSDGIQHTMKGAIWEVTPKIFLKTRDNILRRYSQ